VALEFRDQLEAAFEVLERRIRGEEIARIGQAVAADRPQVRKAHERTEVLAHIAACLAIRQCHPEADAARDHRDLLRLHVEHAQFGFDVQPALLRHDQQLAIGVVEEAALHVAVGRVQVDADADARRCGAIAGHGEQAIDEIGRCIR